MAVYDLPNQLTGDPVQGLYGRSLDQTNPEWGKWFDILKANGVTRLGASKQYSDPESDVTRGAGSLPNSQLNAMTPDMMKTPKGQQILNGLYKAAKRQSPYGAVDLDEPEGQG